MRVIRCEHPEGKRAFKAMHYELDAGDWGHLPSPYEDIPSLIVLREEHVCAALPHTLDDWFPPELRAGLRAMGFRFVVLDLLEGKHWCGEYQAVFYRRDAVEVEEYVQ